MSDIGDHMDMNGDMQEEPSQALVPMVQEVAARQEQDVADPTLPSSSGRFMPELHLHRHEHVEVREDAKAQAVITRLIAQHRELFSFLHDRVQVLEE